MGKDNYKMRREAFKFWDLVRLILETLRYMSFYISRIQLRVANGVSGYAKNSFCSIDEIHCIR